MWKKLIYSLSLFSLLSIFTYRANASGPFLQKSDADGIVSMEAENYDDNVSKSGYTWTLVTSPAGASDSNAMQAQPDLPHVNYNSDYVNNSPHMDFKVSFTKTGKHYIWVRGHANGSGSHDSCHSGLDNQAIASSDRLSFETTANWGWFNNTLDSTPALFNVPSTGVHTVNIWMRENGAIVDKIFLTTNPNYVPSGEGPEESSRDNHDPLSVDDFESYDENKEIFKTWIPNSGTGAEIGHPNPPYIEPNIVYVDSNNSMPYYYDNSKTDKAYYSEADRTFAEPQDWAKEGVKALTLYFYGNPTNAPERMYMALKDDSNKIAVVYYDDYDGDPNDVRDPNWHEWNIDLKKFTDVNLTAVKKVYIGFGDRYHPASGGSGLVYFDDIRLYPTRCVPSRVEGDFNDDCVVNYADLEIMTADWPNGYKFAEFALLAENWLKKILWP